MLSQRLESVEKSQTLPRMDGQDEGDTLESQFEILSIANSCPDLTVLELKDAQNGIAPISAPLLHRNEDVVDGLFFKHTVPVKPPLSFRRSTSLNSLAADDYKDSPNAVDGNAVGVMQSGCSAKIIGKLEEISKKDRCNQESAEFLLPSHNGSGALHKSISSPSVPQIFFPVTSIISDVRPKIAVPPSQRAPPVPLNFSQQQSSKRSFFRRKHKTKSGSINSHPPVVVQHYRNLKMDSNNTGTIGVTEDKVEESAGSLALSNPALSLQDDDPECWAMFMNSDGFSALDEKEKKRQEHMYELIITEKHHCLTLALMHYLFLRGMRKSGYNRAARQIFPGLAELLQVHCSFFQQMRERQLKFRDMGKPMDTLADLLWEQFSGEKWQQMVRLYGLLCSSHKPSLELFKSMQKDPKFAALVNAWSKEPMLARKNVPECLLLVAQRITKYPLLFEPLQKTSQCVEEKEKIVKLVDASKELNQKVNERVREREGLIEFCQRLDSKSMVQVGQKRFRKEDLTQVPTRRLLFTGVASVTNRVPGSSTSAYGSSSSLSGRSTICNVLILTDSIIFAQEVSGRFYFVGPPILPGIVMLNHLIVRENATQNSSLFLVLGTGTTKPEMIELQVINPSHRNKWVEIIRDASTKCQEEFEIVSDVDEDFLSDGADYPDSKTARALEELHEHDKQILSLLRSRSKLVDTLRTDKPHLWTANHFEGKDDILNSITQASNEVQRLLNVMDAGNANGVNRSASCASEHVSAMLSGLPRRADTFGGFDSQQRSNFDHPANVNCKALYQVVVQLADVCGEIFQQFIPQLTPQINQSQHQLQRRMEDLREAQQRLETEKAEWQRQFMAQKEQMEQKEAELQKKLSTLQDEEKDVAQQREQLYRKLEALQRQGIRPNLDAVSPGSLNPAVEKNITVALPPRRPVPPPPGPVVAPQNANNVVKLPRQQIPHFLANSSAVKALSASSPPPGAEAPKPLPRTTLAGMQKVTSVPANLLPGENIATNRSSQGKGSRGLSRGSSQPVQQLLPYRLSEGLKTSSLPRGVGSRSTSSVGQSQNIDQESLIPSSMSKSRNSAAVGHGHGHGHGLHHSHSTTGGFAGESSSHHPYGPSITDRMSSYYKSTDPRKVSNGFVEFNYGPNVISNSSVPIVHRRSGSSPVPMSTIVHSNSASSHHQREDDSDSSNILFL